jgi:hypothetical protein
MRNKRKIFNALLAYKTSFQKASRGIHVLARKMDLWLQRRGFKKWHMQNGTKIAHLLIANTGGNADNLNTLK